MAIELTARTERSLQEIGIEPNLAVLIDGVATTYSTNPVLDFIKIGEPGLLIDGTWFIGGFRQIQNNKDFLDADRTTYTIRQQINYDENKTSSISSMKLGMIDKDQEITKLISPGEVVADMLGRSVRVLAGFGVASFFEDYIQVFQGVVTENDSGAGDIVFKINHPDTKKNVTLFQNVATSNPAQINTTITSIPVGDTSSFVIPSGPVTGYLRVNSEIMQYTGYTGNTFTGVTRGVLGTSAQTHDANSTITSLYALSGNPIDLSLQLMLSGHGTDPVFEDQAVTSFVKVGAGTTQVANAIFLQGVNIPRDLGIQIGDTVTTTGATNGANNFTARTITDIQLFTDGYYIVVDGAALVLEADSSATMNIFTQYNTMPDGMRMRPNEVDIDEHIRIRDFFHSASQVLIYIKEDEINGKEFLEEQLYRPFACYAIPRKTRASIGYTVGPIPGEFIQTVNEENVVAPDSLRLKRGSNRSFFNEVVYKYEDAPIESEEAFTRGLVTISQTSKNRIPGVDRTWTVNALGLRESLNAANIVASQSQRVLARYEFGAERVEFKLLFGTALPMEIGDIFVFDGLGLQVSDISRGDRLFEKRLFEVQNKTINLKTGDTTFVGLDTGLNIDTRFGLQSPCSLISGVISTSQFTIGPSATYPSKFGADEWRKWRAAIDQTSPISIRVHNADYSVDEDLVVTTITEELFQLQTPATITLTVGLIVEFTGYADTDTSDKQKLLYAYMTNDANFGDGGFPYAMI